MPGGGSKVGERRGGRIRGTPNKATVIKQEQQAEAQEIAAMVGADPEATMAALTAARIKRFNAYEELIELALVVKGYIASFQKIAGQPGPDIVEGEGKKRTTRKSYNPALVDEVKKWGAMFNDIAKEVAQYQRPKLRATEHRMIFGEEPKEVIDVEAKVVRMGNPVAASRAYQRFMQAPRETPVLPPPKKRA